MKKLSKFEMTLLVLEANLDCIRQERAIIKILNADKDYDKDLKKALINRSKQTIKDSKQRLKDAIDSI
jgi:hypothetical protein